jgi:hypothetical protein
MNQERGMSKVLIAIVMFGMSWSMLAAQDNKPKPGTQSESTTAQLRQLEDEDQQLEQHEEQLAKAVNELLSDLKVQHQRNRERQKLIQQEDQQWLHDLKNLTPGL